MNRHPAPADGATAAAVATADDRQVEYFLRLLSQICRRTNLRINMYQRAIAVADAGGDVGYVCAFRHLTNIEEHDRRMLEGLIGDLQRRFPRPEPAEVPPNPSEGAARGPVGPPVVR
jgi:hypothetical protein